LIVPSLLILGSLGLILLGSALFTNGIEWIGKRFNLSAGATGSVLSGVGTALPETLIPFMAILLGDKPAEKEIGIGAILGAPFMLTTLTLPIAGAGVYFLSKSGKRPDTFDLHLHEIGVDLKTFLGCFSLAALAALLENRIFHMVTGIGLILVYFYYLKVVFARPSAEHSDLDPLFIQKRNRHPGMLAIGTQTLTGLALIVGGADYFISGIVQTSAFFRISPLILSLVITPVATELPEKFNSLIWISKRKDHLAISNVTGALVFQSTFPVAIGLMGTVWHFDRFGMLNALLTLITALYLLTVIRIKGQWRSIHLIAGIISYAAFYFFLIFHP